MSSEAMVAEPSIKDRLTAFVAASTEDPDARIVDLERIGVGRSRENWIFDLDRPGHEREPLILRRDPLGGLVDTDRGVEFRVLRALESSGLPSPQARWLDADGHWLGRPSLIMRRANGVCDYKVVNGSRPLEARVRLAHDFCALLAQVHAVDWAALDLGDVLVDPGPDAARHELDRWEEILRQDQLEALPELDLTIALLRDGAPRSSRTVLVHADFKPGNILLEGSNVAALLDWELVHLGDPLEDLGWVTQPLRASEHLIVGSWEADDLVASYTKVSGEDVDPAALSWWVAFSALKTAIMQVSGLRAFVDRRSDEPFRPTRKVLSTALRGASEWSTR